MALNSRAMKYVPTSNKKGKIVTMGIAVEAGELETISASHVSEVLCDGNRSFVGVIARTPHDVEAQGEYVNYSPEDMLSVRLHEAIKAANIASYQSLYLLNYGELTEVNEELVGDIVELLDTYRPEVIYTYSPLDKSHEHIVCLKAMLIALTRVEDYKPEHIYAVDCEGVSGLLDEEENVYLDLDTHAEVIDAMLSVYVSLNEAGLELYAAPSAIDLVPHMYDKKIDLAQLAVGIIDRARAKVIENLK